MQVKGNDCCGMYVPLLLPRVRSVHGAMCAAWDKLSGDWCALLSLCCSPVEKADLKRGLYYPVELWASAINTHGACFSCIWGGSWGGFLRSVLLHVSLISFFLGLWQLLEFPELCRGVPPFIWLSYRVVILQVGWRSGGAQWLQLSACLIWPSPSSVLGA